MKSKNERTKAQGRAAAARRGGERGAALATALLLMVLMGVVAASIVAVSSAEINVASQDLQQMRTMKAAEASLEHMTNQFSDVFQKTISPTAAQLASIASNPPSGLTAERFDFAQTLELDSQRLAVYRARSTSATSTWPTVVLPPGSNAFAGLYASLVPYKMRSKAIHMPTGTEVTLEREINSYLIPLFQFGMFSDGDIELHTGAPFTFNGRMHANGNIYLNGDVTVLNKVTTAGEIVTDVIRNGSVRANPNVRAVVGSVTVPLTQGSAEGGPNFGATSSTQRGYAPDSPAGAPDQSWDSNSILPATGVANRFGGQLVTRSTGGTALKLPLELGGNPTREIIKRRLPNDDQTLSEGRYHTKAKVRILIDDEVPGNAYNNAAGIPAGKGVELGETNAADPYYFKPMQLAGGKALWRVSNSGSFTDTSTTAVRQARLTTLCSASTDLPADTVRSVRAAPSAGGPALSSVLDCSAAPNNRVIPRGAGIRGRVYIEIVDSNGVARDVTRQILSMGMTVGEPNAILHFQRPMWAAFAQGSRDRSGAAASLNQLVNLLGSGATNYPVADGELKTGAGGVIADPAAGFLKGVVDDETTQPLRSPTPPALNAAAWTEPMWNSIVPISVYNIREGWIKTSLSKHLVYERGITQVVEVNMKNLVRWLDGVYDSNLLAGTPAVSAHIAADDGFVVYFSDRRGDSVGQESYSAGSLTATNGTVDNEDIYGPNNALDPGEDVIDHGVDPLTGAQKKGSLQKDTCELPDPVQFTTIGQSPTWPDRLKRAREVSSWMNLITTTTNPCGPQNSAKYFRSAVRLFNGENLRTTGAAGKLSATKGITFATENMLYLWGNYNTTGINVAPAAGQSSLNNCAASSSCYSGNQVPAAIVCDAIIPLSKTWYDASSSLFPEGDLTRYADANLTSVADETSVRAGIVAGNNLSSMAGTPDAGNDADSRLSGGMHNFPRFMENWYSQGRRWNFTGSFVPLYRSTQAVGQWNYWDSFIIYGAPTRNWSFDGTFTDPSRLPPGTPTFQYIEPTGFRQVLGY